METGESREIAVCAPELSHPIRATEGDHPSVMDQRPFDPAGGKHLFGHTPVVAALGQSQHRRGFQPCINLGDGIGDGGGRIVDARMGRNGNEMERGLAASRRYPALMPQSRS